ncbi:MAG: TolC family outer membrane protein [Pelagibacteraceae bacterium]
MRIFILTFLIFLKFNFLYAENLKFYLESAFKNNPKLNAERKNFKSIKENINISRSEFLPSVTISGDISSKESTNRSNQSGSNLSDTNLNTETTTVAVDQKIFQGLKGYNSLKKSNLEVERAKFQLQDSEQELILDSVKVYVDLIFKEKNKKFNIANLDLFERQVETDRARLQKGEITLTDLAQSESALARANANLISATTDLLTTRINFEKIIRIRPPEEIDDKIDLKINLPQTLKEALSIATNKNPKLNISQLDYDISKKSLEIEKANFSPSASLNYSKSESDDFSSTVDKVDQETVKATVTWPIIKGGKNYSSIKKSQYQKERSSLLLEDTKNEVETMTTNTWSIYQSSKSVLNSTKAQLKAAEIANEGITLEYDTSNTRTTLDLIQSRSLLLEARIANAKAERDFLVSKFELLSQIGDLSLSVIRTF